MIHRVSSSLPSFKTLDLRPGLNILLSEKSKGATDQQTRNRTGKSTLIELIHFVCGANLDAESPFRARELSGASFSLDLDIMGAVARASRSASEPSKMLITGDTVSWPKEPRAERDSSRRVLSLTAWREVLGRAFFGLDSGDEPEETETTVTRPTFRSLFSYFARRETIGGMREPTRNHSKQQPGDAQIAMCFLMGIDWTIAQQWEIIRQKERHIRELKRIVGQGLLADVLDSASSLRSRLVVADERLRRITDTLSTFRVHEQYHSLEREASLLTRQIADLADKNELDRLYIQELEAAMHAESPPAPADLARMYEEVGIVLPELVYRRYADVARFHESVVRNRQSYLQGELTASLERTRAREAERQQIDARRSTLMTMLQSHGALEQFVALQAEHGRLQAETETLRRRFEAATTLEATSASMETERSRLVERLQQEFSERAEVLAQAIRAFSSIVDDLYGDPGRLEFQPTRNGPEIRITIPGDRSRGIGNMEIFCFDMTVQMMAAHYGHGPRFLIHDSHLFDGVDPRQTGRALATGARLSHDLGFQYLVTLNSDVLSELPREFDVTQHVLPQRLTDATTTGGLFGIRFEPPRSVEPGGLAQPRRRQRAPRSSRG